MLSEFKFLSLPRDIDEIISPLASVSESHEAPQIKKSESCIYVELCRQIKATDKYISSVHTM